MVWSVVLEGGLGELLLLHRVGEVAIVRDGLVAWVQAHGSLTALGSDVW